MSEKKLVRDTSNEMVAGVCAGLARYFDIDAVIIRLVFVVLALAGGPGVLLYIILWIIMPESGSTPTTPSDPISPPESKM